MEKTDIEKKKLIINIILLIALIIVLLFAIYAIFFSESPDFSPLENEISYEDARFLLSSLGEEGITWYCGKTSAYTDEQGNEYNEKSLEELKKIFGNEERLKKEFC